MSFLTIEKYTPHRLTFSRKAFWVFFLLVVPFIITAVWALTNLSDQRAQAATGINHQISYQGKIANSSSTPLTGDYNFKFEFYDDATLGSQLWEEIWATSTSRVSVSSGIFSVALGTYQGCDIFNNDNVYLQVSFDSDGDGTYDQVFLPRKRITAAPYAFNSDTIDGFNASTTPTANTIPVLDSVAGLTLNGVTSTNGLTVQGISVFTGNLSVTGNVTTTGYLTVGSAPAGANFSNGDLNIQNKLVVGDTITLGGVARNSWPIGGVGGTDVNWTYNPLLDTLTPATTTSGIKVNGTSTFGNINASNSFSLDYWDEDLSATSTNNYLNEFKTGNVGMLHIGDAELLPVIAGVYGYSTSTVFDPYYTAGIFGLSNGLGVVGKGSIGVYGQGNEMGGFFESDGESARGLAVESNGVNATGLDLRVGNDDTSAPGSIGIRVTGSSDYEIGTGMDLDLVHGAAYGLKVYNASTTGYSIYSEGGKNYFSGNVGIGTSTPAETLDVYGSVQVSSGNSYKLNGVNLAYGSTIFRNYFFGGAGTSTMIGTDNNTFGSLALSSNISGTSNIAIGSSALRVSTSSSYNIAIGPSALQSNTSGYDNVSIGYQSLFSNTTGYSNVAYGNYALMDNTTGYGNVASGYYALGRNTIGMGNTANGYGALLFNTTGDYNTAVGQDTLRSNTEGHYNTAVGMHALYYNTTGTDNTGIGLNALLKNTTGDNNTSIGVSALFSNVTGDKNTSMGYASLYYASTTIGMTAIGYYSGYGDSTSISDYNSLNDTYSTFIGMYSSRDNNIQSSTPITKATAIGYNSKVGGSNMMALGGMGTNAVLVGIGTSTPNAYLNIYGTSSANDLLRVATSTNQNILLVSKNGNVGINTSTPTERLSVAGNINISLGSSYKYNGSDVIIASTTLSNYFFGGAGNLNMTGASNTAVGLQALFSNTSGSGNTANGFNSLYKNSSASFSTAYGAYSLYSNQTGLYNTATGYKSLYYNTVSYNTAYGYMALTSNTTGEMNSAIGFDALASNTIGSGNTANGADALFTNSTGYNNTASGNYSLHFNIDGRENTANGAESLYTNVSGTANTASGYQSLYGNIHGDYNTADGYQALYANTTANNNVAVGFNALHSNTIGNDNVAVGYESLYSGTGVLSQASVSIGYQSLYSNQNSWNNTAVGYKSLYNSTGIFNTAVGGVSGDRSTTGAGNTFLGYNANLSAAASTSQNSTAIGYQAEVGGSNMLVLGGTGAFAVSVGIGTSTPAYTLDVVGASTNTARFRNSALGTTCSLVSGTGIITCSSDIRLKKNIDEIYNPLESILALNPVSFYWKKDEGNLYKNYGFIAQEVESVIPELVQTDSDGMKSLAMDNMIPFLTGAIQQQQTQIDDLTSLVNSNLNVSFDNNTPLSVSDSNSVVDNLRVTQSASFYGTISVIGEAGFKSKVTFEKEVNFQDHINVDKDTAGTAVVLSGATSTEVMFTKPYSSVPKVVATLNNLIKLDFAVINKSSAGFTIALLEPASQDLEFDWIAMGVNKTEPDDFSNSNSSPDVPLVDLGEIVSSTEESNPSSSPVVIEESSTTVSTTEPQIIQDSSASSTPE